MSNAISQSLLPEFDMEMMNTRKVLERVPEMQGAFKPHQKSMSLARLAGHVAEMPTWGMVTLAQDELDMRPEGTSQYQAYVLTRTADAVKFFDENYRLARELLTAATDETMMRTWTLKDQGKVLMALPKVAVLRGFVMNHMIHHRAQLLVYLRMNDVPLPGLYGPSADEQ
ncbi:MAG: DinB family protein [Acidobacteria bacterium]|nr:DinB family protein [Acidobacteriota bacterium]